MIDAVDLEGRVAQVAPEDRDETELVRAKLGQLEGYVELYRSLGGGWSEAELRRVMK